MSETKRLKDISLFIGSGITPRRDNTEYWENGTIPWLKTEQLGEKNIYDTNEKITQYALNETSIKTFPVNTLSMAMYGEGRTRGNVSILKTEMTTNQACCNIVIDSKKADYEFVYYYLKTQYEQLRKLSSGVRRNLNSNDIKEYEIRLPSKISEQQKITAVLSVLDAKIELNQRINAELESMAKTLYDYWFVQFDFPNEKGKQYKSAGGKMV
jgi:type I restriction enzyme, S subunit